MLTWLLFYTSLLDLAKTPEQDVLDPGGLVKSQVVQSADGALRIVLNASQSRHALSTRFLWEAFGSGVQHIAFATDDIFATVARLEANGVALLPIPENYYDDLEAKTDLAGRSHRGAEGAQHPLRPGGRGRVPAGLHRDLRGPLLLRDRRAARLQGLRRRQRADPPRRPGPPRARSRRALALPEGRAAIGGAASIAPRRRGRRGGCARCCAPTCCCRTWRARRGLRGSRRWPARARRTSRATGRAGRRPRRSPCRG